MGTQLQSDGPGDSIHTAPSAHDRRTRALTCMISALRTTADSAVPLKPNPVVSGSGGTNNVNTRWLKLLNHVALLLVREHEIVAVLPKRSGPQSHVNIMVTDCSRSSSGGEDYGHLRSKDPQHISTPGETPQTKYFVNRDAHFSAQTSTASHAIRGLETAETQASLMEYLNSHRNVSFPTHVLSVEALLNKCITQLVSGRPAADITLLQFYITFRAAPKMSRWFKSTAFASFSQTLQSLTRQEVSMSVAQNFLFINIGSRGEWNLIGDILYSPDFAESVPTEYPYLYKQWTAGKGHAVYDHESAWEFHKLLLCTFALAKKYVNSLTAALKSPTSSILVITVASAKVWMNFLHKLVYHSPIFQAHIDAVETLVAKKIKGPPVPDEDSDGGQMDTDLEMNIAQANYPSRVTQQTLWLAVSYQQAMEVVTNHRALPKFPISLTFWEPPATHTATEMERWTSVIRGLYPSSTPSAQPIMAQEAINALIHFGINNKGKSSALFTHESRLFHGKYHAESMLATLAYLSCHPHCETHDQLASPAEEELALFKNTYGAIGVSKRCCPVCTKLLSLLSKHSQMHAAAAVVNGSGDEAVGGVPVFHEPELTVLNSHANIYPTALPPFLPKEVAEELVWWLEGMLRNAVKKVVKRERRGSSGSAGSRSCRE